MSVLEVLAKEHAVFREANAQLRSCFQMQDSRAERHLRDILLALIPALERHEEIEDIVFGHSDVATASDILVYMEEAERQHRLIDSMRGTLLAAVRGSRWKSIDQMRPLVLPFVAALEAHLSAEERRLWPAYLKRFSRSLAHSAERQARDSLRRLELDLAPKLAHALER
ncbi:MAG: hemerythrin domain-containing protein [Elusimicrobia bacterium]|nr:hemerythrin domain-containing protein [Elusimicrobiota bacterium]